MTSYPVGPPVRRSSQLASDVGLDVLMDFEELCRKRNEELCREPNEELLDYKSVTNVFN